MSMREDAARIVAGNWRIRKRLPRLAELARQMGWFAPDMEQIKQMEKHLVATEALTHRQEIRIEKLESKIENLEVYLSITTGLNFGDE